MTKKYYLVDQKYYDNGKVKAIIKEVNYKKPSFSESKEKYDHYQDTFNTLKEAETFKQNCLDA